MLLKLPTMISRFLRNNKILKIVGLIDFSDQRNTRKVKLMKGQLEKNALHKTLVLPFQK